MLTKVAVASSTIGASRLSTEGWIVLVAQFRRAALLAIAFGLPILFVPDALLDPFDVPKLALLTVCVAFALALTVVQLMVGREKLRGIAVVPAALVIIPLSVAWLFSSHHAWALVGEHGRFRGLLPYLAVVVFGVLAAEAFAIQPLRLAWALAGAGAIVGAYAFVQMLGLDPFFSNLDDVSWAISTLGHTNFTGGFLAIALPCAVYLWVSQKGRAAMIATILIAVGLILSNSHGGWAAAVAGIAILVGELLRPRVPWSRIAGAAVGGLAVAVTVGVVVFGMVDRSNPLVPATAVTRGDHWQQALHMAWDSPLVGWGPDAFALEGMRYRTPEGALLIGAGRADDPHSVPLAMLANAGILGLIGYAGLIVWVVRLARRTTAPSAAPFLGALAAYFVQSLVSIDELSLRVALWIALAGLVATTAQARDHSPASPRSHSKSTRGRSVRILAGTVSAVLIIGGVGWWTARFVAADVHAAAGNRLFDKGEVGPARQHLESAVALRDESRYRIALSQGLGLAALEERGRDEKLNAATLSALERGGPPRDIDEALTRSYLISSLAAFDTSLYPSALEAYEQARSLDPYNPRALAGLSEVLVALGRSDDAVRTVEPLMRALQSGAPVFASGDVADALGALSMAQLAAGDRSAAKTTLDQAMVINADECRILLAQELLVGSEASTSYRPDINRQLLVRFRCDPSRYRAMVNLLPPEVRSSYE